MTEYQNLRRELKTCLDLYLKVWLKMRKKLRRTRTYDLREEVTRAKRSQQVVGVGLKKRAVTRVYDRRDVSRAAQSQPVVGVGCNATNTVQIECRETRK